MADGVKSSNTAVTDRDKVEAARTKDAQKNLDYTSDVPVEEQTAAHALLPSTIDAFATRHDLTTAEAAQVLSETDGGTASASKIEAAVDAVRAGRSVNRPVYIQQPAGLSHPMASVPTPTVPTPPSAQEIDPTAPALDDPTAHVVKADGETRTPEDVADEFAERADEAVATVDEAVEQTGENEGPQIATE